MFNFNRALLLAGMRLGIPEALQMIQIQPPPMPGRKPGMRIKRGYHKNRTTYFAPNGECECARRRRQIARGQLKAENGLVTS